MELHGRERDEHDGVITMDRWVYLFTTGVYLMCGAFAGYQLANIVYGVDVISEFALSLGFGLFAAGVAHAHHNVVYTCESET